MDSTTADGEDHDHSTTMADGDDMTSAAARSGGLGTALLALLAFSFMGSAAGAAVDGSTTMAEERRLMDSTTADDHDHSTTMAEERRLMDSTTADGDDHDHSTTMADGDDMTSPAAPRASFRTAAVIAIAAALGLAAWR